MIAIRFEKTRAEHYLDSLQNGLAIQPPDGPGWTVHEMLALAGACYFAAMSHGPPLQKNTDSLHHEHREMVEEEFYGDLHAAIEFNSQLSMMVKDGDYDAQCGPVCTALVENRDGQHKVIFTEPT
jgi:hypothetical protein